MAIRFNLKGREPLGLVDPRDADGLRARITAFLQDLRDAETGEHAVEEVINMKTREDGPKASCLPDLVAIWRNYQSTPALRSSIIEASSHRSDRLRPGNHTDEGFVIAAGAHANVLPETEISISALGGAIADLVRAAKRNDSSKPSPSRAAKLARRKPVENPGQTC